MLLANITENPQEILFQLPVFLSKNLFSRNIPTIKQYSKVLIFDESYAGSMQYIGDYLFQDK